MEKNDVYNAHRRASMCTRSGREFRTLDPRAEDVHLGDVVWHLASRPRYNGATHDHYSVAEHSVLVSRYCQLRWPTRLDWHREALLHDAAEAYLPDWTGPVKRDPRVAEWFLPIEERVDRVVAEALGVGYPRSPEVDYADKEVLKLEVPAQMPVTDWWKIQPPDGYAVQLEVLGLDREAARALFWAQYHKVFDG